VLLSAEKNPYKVGALLMVRQWAEYRGLRLS